MHNPDVYARRATNCTIFARMQRNIPMNRSAWMLEGMDNVVQSIRARAEWILLNGKWVRRQLAERKSA